MEIQIPTPSARGGVMVPRINTLAAQPGIAPAAAHEIIGYQQLTQKTYIGIDPGTTTGIAIYHRGGITSLQSGSHSQMLLHVLEVSQRIGSLLTVILEDVHADKTNFVASQFIRGMMANPALIKKLPNEKARKAYCINAACKRSRDSGMTAGYALDWKAFFSQHGIAYATLAPSMRDNAESILAKLPKGINPTPVIAKLKAPTKLTASQFKALTGCQLPSNEHNRDAGTLAWWYAREQEKIQLQ